MNLQDEAIERIEELIYGEEDEIWPESRDARGDARKRLAAACAYARGDDRADEPAQGVPREGGSGPESNRRLVDWADRAFILIEDWPARIQPSGRATAGAEHYVWPLAPRWIKATFGIQHAVGLYPCVDHFSGSSISLRIGYGDKYLERLYLMNQIFGDDMVLHAVLSDEYGSLSLITSQPDRSGDPASAGFIREAMSGFNFVPVSGVENAYYRSADNIAVFDLHEENAVRDNDVLRVIDPIILHPTGVLLEAIQRRAAP